MGIQDRDWYLEEQKRRAARWWTGGVPGKVRRMPILLVVLWLIGIFIVVGVVVAAVSTMLRKHDVVERERAAIERYDAQTYHAPVEPIKGADALPAEQDAFKALLDQMLPPGLPRLETKRRLAAYGFGPAPQEGREDSGAEHYTMIARRPSHWFSAWLPQHKFIKWTVNLEFDTTRQRLVRVRYATLEVIDPPLIQM